MSSTEPDLPNEIAKATATATQPASGPRADEIDRTFPAPWTSRFHDLNGLRYHYLDEGQGSPIVMVHGNPTWSFYFRHLLADLCRDYRVVVPDHIGCGLSDKPVDQRYPYRLVQRMEDLVDLLDSLALKRQLTLVLHDWGGMIGLLYASRFRDRIARLVLLNTAGFGLPPGKGLPWSLRLARSPFGPLLVQGMNGFCKGLIRYGTVKPMPAAVQQQYLRPYDTWGHRRAVLRFVQDIPLFRDHPSFIHLQEVESQLSHWQQIPTTIIWGRHDFVFDEDFRAEWVRRLPTATMHVLEAGHLVLEDEPTTVTSLIRQFLEAHPLQS